MAQALEEMDEVVRYVKNHNLGFTIPYTLNGEEHGYIPDYIARIRLPSPAGRDESPTRLYTDVEETGSDNLLNLILEVSGEPRKDKAAKVATARTLWVPAVNNHGGFGRWAFIEISDPWDAKNTMRAFLRGEKVDGVGPLLREKSVEAE